MRKLLILLMLLLCCTQSEARQPRHGAAVVSAPFTLTGVSLLSSPFLENGAASTVVGTVNVSSTGTLAGTVTISLTGTNAQGFRLDTTAYPGAHVICPSGGCPSGAGPYTDLTLVATDASAVGSPQSVALSLTGTALVISGVSVSPNTFVYSSAANTTIGTVTVATTPPGLFTGTLAISGANASHFALSGSTITCPTSGPCPSSGGPFTDLNIVPTQAGATGSGTSFAISLTGTGPVVTSQIHNAPGWQTSHSYSPASGPKTRVVNGAGWTPGSSTYTPGLALNAYELISSSCTSASSGGPTTTATDITDGSCHWKYLSAVDYISITGWAYDNQPWTAKTYTYGDMVTSGTPLRTYFSGANPTCVSTVAPSGTASGVALPGIHTDPGATGFNTSDGCLWLYMADVIYTSRTSYIPTQTFTNPNAGGEIVTVNMRTAYQAQIWNDRTYSAGANGENSPIRTQMHFDQMYDSVTFAAGYSHCASCGEIELTAASGESFRDSLTSAVPITGIDATKGVTLSTTVPISGGYPFESAGFMFHDNQVSLDSLQIVSTQGAGVSGLDAHGNNETITNCIVDGGSNSGGEKTALSVDTISLVANNLIIARGSYGVVFKYAGTFIWNTLVQPAGTGDTGVGTGAQWPPNIVNTAMNDNAIFGFAHAASMVTVNTQNPANANNITDTASGDSGTTLWYSGITATVVTIPGTTYSATAAGAFVAPWTDYRPKTGGTLVNAGAPYGNFNQQCLDPPACTASGGLVQSEDTPDMLKATRPRSGQYDIGPIMHQ